MALAIAILVVAVLTFGFFGLTSLEAKSGKRLFAKSREKFDADADHAFSVMREVDLGKLIFHALHVAWDHFVHEVVHVILVAVRFLERTLTRIAREIRGRRAEGVSPVKPFAESVDRIKAAMRKEEKQDTIENTPS